MFVVYRGLTTYQWIQNSREKAERIASEKDIPAANYDANKNKAKVRAGYGLSNALLTGSC